MIPLFMPDYDEMEERAVARVLQTRWSGMGPETTVFEEEFAERVKANYAVAMNSCTSALQIALLIRGIGPGDEVIVPSLTFLSTAHAVVLCKATPVFCDVKEHDLNICWNSVSAKITPRTKAIIGVTYSGSCLSLSSALSSYSNIPVIWDCAHSAGARHKEESVPTIACWSFHSVKNLSCGDGGMLTTKDVDIANRARALRWMGIDKSTWERTGDKYSWDYNCKEIGIKGHMNDVTAAIGRVQLSKLSVMQSKRHSIANMYTHELEDVVQCPYLPYDHGLHLYVIRVDEDKRNALVKGLNERGVQAGVHYRPLHFYSCYEGPIQPQLPVVEREWKRIVSLPLHSCMTLEDADIVCDAVKEVLA